MEEIPFDGDSPLVDHSRCDPAEGAFFAVRTVDGPEVKRLRCVDGRRWAISDNSAGVSNVTTYRTAATEKRHRVTWREWENGAEGGRGRGTPAPNVVDNVKCYI